MPRQLFDTVISDRAPDARRTRYTVPVSIAVHAAILAGLVILPVLATDALPDLRRVIVFTGLPAEAPPPPPAAPTAAMAARATVTPEAAPTVAPAGVAVETGLEPDVSGGLESVAVQEGVVSSVLGGFADAPSADAPPPPAPREPVRVGGQIRTPQKVAHVDPVYPPIALQAKVEGIVILEATLDERGAVVDIRVLRSIPLLDAAAIAAVQQWRYTPTLLNGTPTKVIMTVTVRFAIGA